MRFPSFVTSRLSGSRSKLSATLARLARGGLPLAVVLAAMPSAAPAQIQFTDVSAAAGIDPDLYSTVTIHSLGVNWIDYDNDDWPDLFLVNGTGLTAHLYHNEGDGTFTKVDSLLPALPDVEMSGSVFADYDNDGDSDIYIFTDNIIWDLSNFNPPDGPANLLLQNLWEENGRRTIPGQPLFQEVAAAVGVDDLAVPPLGVLPGHRSKAGGWVDFDRDGWVDLYVSHMVMGEAGGEVSNRDRLFRNVNGVFQDVTVASGVNPGTDPNTYRPTLAFIAGHLNNDLDPDLYVVNISAVEPSPIIDDFIFLNNGDSTFTDLVTSLPFLGDDAQAGMGIDLADVDLDGDWDVYMSDQNPTLLDELPQGNVLYLNNGDGTFADNSAPAANVSGGNSCWGVSFFDMEHDGDEDLFVSNGMQGGGPPQNFLYLNDGTGIFTDIASTSGFNFLSESRGTATADYDGDGDLDLAMVDQGGTLRLFRNDTPAQGNWLQVELRAVQSNRDAINSLVEVDAGPLSLMRQIEGGSSAHSQDTLVLHFGLDTQALVDEVRVFWPSGVQDTMLNVAANQVITVAEGTTVAPRPFLDVSTLSLDHGQAEVGSSVDRTLTIINDGTQLLNVSNLSATGPFSVIDPATPFDVPVNGGKQLVTVRYTVGVVGPEAGSLDITSNDPDQPLLSVSLSGEGTAAAAGELRINSAGADYTDVNGDLFVADQAYAAGSFGFVGGGAQTFSASPVAGTTDDLLYQTIRGGASFSYQFDVPDGNYDVTLYFMEPWFTAVGARQMDVTIEGVLALDNLDVRAAAGATYTAYSQTVAATVADGQLNVDFAAVTGGNAIVSAIAVVPGAPPVLEPDIDVSPASLNFGSVTTGTIKDRTVSVANLGSQALTVSGLATTGGDFSVVSPAVPFTILSGGAPVVVTVRFAPLALGPQAADLEITSDDPDEGLVTVPLSGEGVDTPPPLRVNAGGADYTDGNGDLFSADQAYAAGSFGFVGGGAQTFSASPVAGTTDDLLYQTIRGGSSFSYQFDVQDGNYDVTLYFMEPWFTAVGARQMDVTIEGALALDNLDIIGAVGATYTAYSQTVAATVADGQLNVDFAAVTGGNAIVSAIAVVPGAPPVLEPDIDVSPASLNFGSVINGTIRDLTVSVANLGAQALTVSGLATTGGDFSVVSPAVPFTILSGGAPVNVTVRFAPLALGAQAADLEITSDDPDEGLVTVPLSGEGVDTPPPVRVNAGGADYTDGNGDLFLADFGFVGGGAQTFSASPVAGTTDDLLYQSMRGGASFSYLFDLPDGGYNVTLYFMEPWFPAVGDRQFDVTVEGALALDNVDIIGAVGATYTAYSQTVAATVADGQLNVDFTAVTGGNAVVSAIAVAPQPAGVPDIAVNTTNVAFGELLVGTTGDQPLTIINDGLQTLNVSSMTTTNGLFTVESPIIPFSVPPGGGTQEVTLRFNAAAATLEQGTLEITSDDPDEPLTNVSLIAEGSATPATQFRINAGGPDRIDALGNLFVADKAFSVGDFGFIGGAGTSYAPADVQGTADDDLYLEMREGPAFTYSFDNLPQGDWEVSLYYTEPTATVLNQRRFDVAMEGVLVRDDWDVFLYSGSPNSFAIPDTGTLRAYRDPYVTTVTDGRLDIDLTVAVGTDAIVSAIHVQPRPAAPLAGYVNVAPQVGIVFNNDLEPTECGPPIGTGSAWADYDGDGDIDLFTTNHGGPNRLYQNQGDTNLDDLPDFIDVAAAAGVDDPTGLGHSAVFIDYDNDGDHDLYVTNWGGNTLYQNRLVEDGTATFLDVTAVAGVANAGRAVTAAWGDFDGDTFLDLYVAKHFTCMPTIQESEDALYHNNGDGTFTDRTDWLCGGPAPCAQTSGLGFAAGWLDYDDDGDQDLYLVNDNINDTFYPNVLWENTGPDGLGGWTFNDVSALGSGLSVNGMGLGIGDYNNDGLLDLAFSNVSPNNLLRGLGGGAFEEVSALAGVQRGWIPNIPDPGDAEQWTWGTAFFDHDNDGWLDVLYVAGSLGTDRPLFPMAFFGNNRDGTFTDLTGTSGLGMSGRARNISVVDIDGDGFVEVFISNIPDTGPGTFPTNGVPWLFHNQSPQMGNGNNWLTVTVQGNPAGGSNRDGIGTRLTLTTPDGMTQIRQISSGPHHGGGDYKAAYFGIGSNASADLVVRWPSGLVQNLGTVAINGTLNLVEP